MRRPVSLAAPLVVGIVAACQGGAPAGSVSPQPGGTNRPSATASSAATPLASSVATPTAQPTAPPTTQPTGRATAPPTQGSGKVVLVGHFVGHQEDPLSTTDVTYDVLVNWKRPNDVQDRLSFTYASGTFDFKTSVGGVCGGNRHESGDLILSTTGDPTSLHWGDIQDPTYQVLTGLIDNRLNQGGLQFSFATHFDIPNGAAECQPPYQSYGYVGNCPIEFKLATLDSLQPDASCTQNGTTWTGHLEQQ